MRTPPPEPSQPAPRPWFGNRRLLWVIAVAIVANLVVAGILGRAEPTPEVPYSVFAAQARADELGADG